MTRQTTIIPKGPFSLERLALFGFGHRHETKFDGVMRMAFCLDPDYSQQVGVAVTQDEQGVHLQIDGDGDIEVIKNQVARILSLNYDANQFLTLGKKDPVLAQLQATAPGLRPPLFYSPYEAAVWSIISARRPAKQMAKVRDALGQAHGKVFELAGMQVAALPTPAQLLTVSEFPGLSPEKIERLHGVAQAAIDGKLSIDYITGQEPEKAMLELQKIKGIGPFYSALIVIRSSGLADVLPDNEPRSLELIRKLYGLKNLPTKMQLEKLAENWKPFRTWVVVYIRAVGPKLKD